MPFTTPRPAPPESVQPSPRAGQPNHAPFLALLDSLARAAERPAAIDVFPCRSNPNRTWFVIVAPTRNAVQEAIDAKMQLVDPAYGFVGNGAAQFDNPKRGARGWESTGFVVRDSAGE